VRAAIRIDVVICTYNRAAMLDRALETLGRQQTSSDVDWSVLVVDNNCTDDTPAVVEHYRKAGLAVSVVREPQQGLTPARRRSLESTTAPWIAFVDDDCLLDEHWVEEAARFAREHPECGAFGGRVMLEWEHEPPDYVRRFPWAYASQDHGREPKRVGLLVGTGMVVRRAALAECGWMSRQFLADRTADRLVSGGDVEIALRIGSCHDLWYVPRCSLRHVISGERTTFGYLRQITFGLGSCKFFEDSMLWPGSYPRWLGASFVRAGAFARKAARDASLALSGHRRAADVAIRLSFLSGWIAGMWHFARKDAVERNAILGCAHVSASR
jgi:glycosyltransferase involved in cell wall biosynthesis